MLKENFLSKIKYLPETTKQFGGLVLIILIISLSFFVLNIKFGGGDELVRKMKLEEERIAKEKKLSELIEQPIDLLQKYKVFMFDMDGVFWRGENIIESSINYLNKLE